MRKYRPCYTCIYKNACGGAGNTAAHPCAGHKTPAEKRREEKRAAACYNDARKEDGKQ